jgi:hypothetical protein
VLNGGASKTKSNVGFLGKKGSMSSRNEINQKIHKLGETSKK